MSWDRWKHEVVCTRCKKKGFCIKGFDDWNRSSTTWIGFENLEPDSNAVKRKKSDSRDSSPSCQCGSTKIEVGKLLGSCDYKGDLT